MIIIFVIEEIHFSIKNFSLQDHTKNIEKRNRLQMVRIQRQIRMIDMQVNY